MGLQLISGGFFCLLPEGSQAWRWDGLEVMLGRNC